MTDTLTHVRIVNDEAPQFITVSAALDEIERAISGDLRRKITTMSAKGSHANMTYGTGERVTIRPATDDDYLTNSPEWGTLKGLEAPFTVWLSETETTGTLYTAGDRKKVGGKPVVIVSREFRNGVNYGTTADGRPVQFWGAATRMWRHQ